MKSSAHFPAAWKLLRTHVRVQLYEDEDPSVPEGYDPTHDLKMLARPKPVRHSKTRPTEYRKQPWDSLSPQAQRSLYHKGDERVPKDFVLKDQRARPWEKLSLTTKVHLAKNNSPRVPADWVRPSHAEYKAHLELIKTEYKEPRSTTIGELRTRGEVPEELRGLNGLELTMALTQYFDRMPSDI